MAVMDTLVSFVATYDNPEDAKADFDSVADAHKESDFMDMYDAAVIERNDDGKVRVAHQHETPTRVGGVAGAGVGLASGLLAALAPTVALTGGLVAGTTAGGAVIGAVAGHVELGMDRGDLKELGELLDTGTAALIVVGVQDTADRIANAISRSDAVQHKHMQSNPEELRNDLLTAQATDDAAKKAAADGGDADSAAGDASDGDSTDA